MQYSNSQALNTPIIQQVITLNEFLVEAGRKVPAPLKHAILDGMQKNAAVLFRQAMRQLKGKDYAKRALETVEEIQSDAFLIHALHGWNNKITCAKIDLMCDDIAKQLYALSSKAQGSQNH